MTAEELTGKLATVTRPTPIGTETILGSIIPPLMIEETPEGKEIVTHVTVEGMIIETKITGLPLPIEEEEPARLELIPIETVTLL